MGKRFLVASYEAPNYGGASTSSYLLFEKMQRDGLDVSYLSITHESESAYFAREYGASAGNPRGLPHVYGFTARGALYVHHRDLSERIERIGPDVMIGVGFIATLLLKLAAPKQCMVFLTSGSQELKDRIVHGRVNDLLEQQTVMERALGPPESLCAEELAAVEAADLIVTHSPAIQSLYRYFFPFHAGKVYEDVVWFAEWICEEADRYQKLKRPFAERDVDVCFVASSWRRPEKNFPLLQRIARQLRGRKIDVVGECETTPHVNHHGLVSSRQALFDLLGRTRVLACPSRFDAAPGVLFEAAAMECNVVASKNCGNWPLCHEQLIVEPYTAKAFARAIAIGVEKKLEDHLSDFRNSASYRNLVETIEVI